MTSSPRPWQRQPGESAADFIAFVAYLRLKGRRSSRAVAVRIGRSSGVVRRLSARFNWPARVHAFEQRLADAKQEALNSVIRTTAVAEQSRLEKLRVDEFQLAQNVLQAADRWLTVLANPRRRLLPVSQVLRLIELADRLGRLAAGLPLGDKQRSAATEPREHWTQPSIEEALEKIYGAVSPVIANPESQSSVEGLAPKAAPQPSPASVPVWPPPDDKHDLTPRALVIGPHGLLCLQPLEN